MRLLERDSRGEGTEGLTHLDHGIDAVAHLGAAGVSENAAMPQGAGSELHSAAIPADHLTGGNPLGGGGAGLLETSIPDRIDPLTELRERGFDVAAIIRRPEEWNGKTRIGHFAHPGGVIKRGAQCRSVVSGSGLHINFVKEAGIK